MKVIEYDIDIDVDVDTDIDIGRYRYILAWLFSIKSLTKSSFFINLKGNTYTKALPTPISVIFFHFFLNFPTHTTQIMVEYLGVNHVIKIST